MTGRLVLVVDDDDPIRRLVRTVLEADDLEVIEAVDGHEALVMAKADGTPTVVVLDVMMPGLDGVETCRRLDHERSKVIMLTARDDPDLEAEALAAGADAFLTKPFSSIELLDLVEKLLGDSG